jgi:hypothetical protein
MLYVASHLWGECFAFFEKGVLCRCILAIVNVHIHGRRCVIILQHWVITGRLPVVLVCNVITCASGITVILGVDRGCIIPTTNFKVVLKKRKKKEKIKTCCNSQLRGETKLAQKGIMRGTCAPFLAW